MTHIVFWISLGCLAYAYLGYPMLAWLLARLVGSLPVAPVVTSDDALPHVSLLIAAHNEAEIITQRITHALQTDYPVDKFEIVVASDGSDDATVERVQRISDSRVRCVDYRDRRGKAAVLNRTVPQLRGDIIAFSDANTFEHPQAMRRLARWFVAERVGVVCGRLILIDSRDGTNVDSMYWRFETFLKRAEARIGALLGANGAIYALRRKRFVPIPDNTIVDDFVIPLTARLEHGCALVYDSEATATEETPRQMGSEFSRRVRIGTGDFQSLRSLWPLLDPRQGWIALSFLSHKIVRWLGPVWMAVLVVTNVLLCREPLYGYLLASQITFYTLAAISPWMFGQRTLCRVIRLCGLFCSVNAALAVGLWRWLRGPQQGAWRRTERTLNTTGPVDGEATMPQQAT